MMRETKPSFVRQLSLMPHEDKNNLAFFLAKFITGMAIGYTAGKLFVKPLLAYYDPNTGIVIMATIATLCALGAIKLIDYYEESRVVSLPPKTKTQK